MNPDPILGSGSTALTSSHLGSVDPAELAAMVVAPAVDGAGAAPGQRPVLGGAVQPLQQLLVVTQPKYRVRELK